MNIRSVTCPNCGSNISADENSTRVVCEFCGSSVVVEDSKQEGYNFELGSMKARANVAQSIADEINELIVPLCNLPRVMNEKTALIDQKSSLEKQANICEKYGKIIVFAIASVITLFILLILNAAKASVPAFLIWGIIAAALFPVVAMVLLKYRENVEKGAEDTELAIVAHNNTIDNYNLVIGAHPNISIPVNYRNERAMSFIRDHMNSQEAQTIEQAISQYENVLRQEKTIALQQEQIRLQQEQIAQTAQLQKKGRTTAYRGKQVVVVKQHGHSIIIHLLLCSVGIGFLTIPYYTLSKHHYWHL